MTLVRTMLCGAAALLCLAAGTGAEDLSEHFVFEQGGDLYARISPTGPATRLCDNAHFEKVTHGNQHDYILLRYDHHRCWLQVLDCDSNGTFRHVHTIADDKLNDVTAIQQTVFLPDGRLFVELHINPWESAGLTLDLKGDAHSLIFGSAFTWNAASAVKAQAPFSDHDDRTIPTPPPDLQTAPK